MRWGGCIGRSKENNLSVSLRSTAPLVGEPLAYRVGPAGCLVAKGHKRALFSLPSFCFRGTIKESNNLREGYRVLTEDGNKKTKIDSKTRICAEKEPGTGADARGAGHLVCGAAAHRAGLCGGQLGVEESPRGAVRPVWLWQLRAGRGGVLSGHSVHAGRRPAGAGVQAAAGADLRQWHGHRVFGHPRRHPCRPDGG